MLLQSIYYLADSLTDYPTWLVCWLTLSLTNEPHGQQTLENWHRLRRRQQPKTFISRTRYSRSLRCVTLVRSRMNWIWNWDCDSDLDLEIESWWEMNLIGARNLWFRNLRSSIILLRTRFWCLLMGDAATTTHRNLFVVVASSLLLKQTHTTSWKCWLDNKSSQSGKQIPLIRPSVEVEKRCEEPRCRRRHRRRWLAIFEAGSSRDPIISYLQNATQLAGRLTKIVIDGQTHWGNLLDQEFWLARKWWDRTVMQWNHHILPVCCRYLSTFLQQQK